MRFSAATVLAFASAALAQTAGFDPITSPTNDDNVPAGSTFEVDWQPSSATTYPGTVSLILLGGSSPSTLSILSTIDSGLANNGKYEWAVASTLGSFSTYGLKLQLDSNSSIFQYSFPFHITGGSSSSASASGSTSASGSASASGSVTTTASSGSMTTSAMMSSVTSAPGNLSTTAGPKTITSIVSASKTTTSGSSVATGAAVNLAAGSFAMLGGLAMAALAL